jgi:hypothetical protein
MSNELKRVSSSTLLPKLPSAGTIDAAKLDDKALKALITEHLKETGVAKVKTGWLFGNAVGGIAKLAKPEIEALRKRDGDVLETRDVLKAIDGATHEQQVKGTRRRSLWIGAAVGVGAMIAGGAATFGINQAFGGLGNLIGGWMGTNGTTLGAGIQAAFSPVMISLVGMFVGACASFINSNVSTPLQAFIIRTAMRGSPDAFRFNPEVRADMLHCWAVEQTVDGRTLGMRYAIMLHNLGLQVSMREVGAELRRARKTTDAAERKEALLAAADHLAGALVHNETMWFYVSPQSNELFKHIMLLLWPHCRGGSQADLDELKKLTVQRVRDIRPVDENSERATLDESVKGFYEPYLAKLLTPPAMQQQAPAQQVVARAS